MKKLIQKLWAVQHLEYTFHILAMILRIPMMIEKSD